MGLPLVLGPLLNFTQCQDILSKNMFASARRLKLGSKWIFQQYNNPKQHIKIHK
jgi:hypothetical protein